LGRSLREINLTRGGITLSMDGGWNLTIGGSSR
jgi:hypothetical protein